MGGKDEVNGSMVAGSKSKTICMTSDEKADVYAACLMQLSETSEI